MREYNILSEKSGKYWGKLYYSDKRCSFRIVFRDDIDVKKEHPPAYVSEFLLTQGNDIRGEFAKLWVTDRIIPKERQNIAEILREAGLSVYREIDMLELCMGRATYDDLYLERVK